MSTAVILMIILANYMVSGNEDCCKEIISEVNSLAQKIDEQCQDDTAGGFILAWLKYFGTILLIALAVGSGVYMSLQLLSLIKSLAEKIDELIKEVKNISRSGGGTEDTKQPGSGTDDTKQPGGGPDDTKQPGGGTDDTKQPGGGTDDTKQPGGGTDDTKQPGGGTDDTKQPGSGADDTKQPGGGPDDTKQPGGGTDDTKQPGGGTDDTKQPGGGTDDTKQPGSGADDTKQPGGGPDDTKQPGGGTDDTKQPGGGTGDKNVPPPPHTRDPASIGDSKKTITGISAPVNIYITDDGKVFITGWGDGHVHIFDKDGNFQKKFKPPTAGLIGVCGKCDRVYVASFSGSKIYEHTTDGELIEDKLRVTQPVGVGVDSDGTFYVSQQATGKIHVHNPDGSKSYEMSGIGTYPRKIQFDSDGNIRVPDFYTGTVFVVSKSGTVISKLKIQGVNWAEGLFVDSDDNMYVCDRSSPGEVYICDKNGKQIKVIKGFKGAGDASIAPDGTLWIADFAGNKVYLY